MKDGWAFFQTTILKGGAKQGKAGQSKAKLSYYFLSLTYFRSTGTAITIPWVSWSHVHVHTP